MQEWLEDFQDRPRLVCPAPRLDSDPRRRPYTSEVGRKKVDGRSVQSALILSSVWNIGGSG